MISPDLTQLLISTLGSAVKISRINSKTERDYLELRKYETQLSHQQNIFDSKADLLRSLINALIEKRVDSVREGFKDVLDIYAEQARHYMAQQTRFADEEMQTSDPLVRANCKARLVEIDFQLMRIRNEAKQLYKEMAKAIVSIGGEMPKLNNENERVISLPLLF